MPRRLPAHVGMRSLRQAAMKASRSQMMEWVLPWTSESIARRRGASMLRGIHGSWGANDLHTADGGWGKGGWTGC